VTDQSWLGHATISSVSVKHAARAVLRRLAAQPRRIAKNLVRRAARMAGLAVNAEGAIVLASRARAPAASLPIPQAQTPAGSIAARALRASEQLTYLCDIINHGGDARLANELRTVPAIGQRLYFRSSACTAQDFRHPEFQRWRTAMAEPARLHRKIWEHVFIAAHLEAAGVLGEGRRGIGFGVGQEPLPAAFAARGASIVATDMSPDAATAAGWIATQQHAAGLDGLNRKGLCPDDLFRRNVTFAVCDMNRIPSRCRDFDFTWSSCSLEHLGTIQAGLDFIKASVRALKVGGIAVHTTEYNVSSNDDTIDNNPSLVFLRRRDIERVVQELRAEGHHVADVCFDVLSEPIDLFVDLPPFVADTHLRLALANFVATSIGLVIQRGR